MDFIGVYERKMDDKCRISIPICLLDTLRKQGASGLFLVPSADRYHFDLFSSDYIEENFANLEYERGSTIFGRIQKTNIDAAGRLQISKDFARKNFPSSHVLFIKTPNVIQIWDPVNFEEAEKAEIRVLHNWNKLAKAAKQEETDLLSFIKSEHHTVR